MQQRGWVLQGIVTGIIGAFYEFVPRKVIKSIAEFLLFDETILGHRTRHNDLILLGIVLLIVSFVSFYKVYRLRRDVIKVVRFAKKSKSTSGRRRRK